MNNNDNADHVTTALIAVVVPLMLGWLLRSANAPARQANGMTWVEYGTVIKGFVLFFVAIFVGLIAVWFQVDQKSKEPVLYLIGMSGAMTAPLVVEMFFVRIGYNPDQLHCFSGWRKQRIVRWEDVVNCKYSPGAQWWVLETRNQGKIRLSIYLSGVKQFLDEVRKRGIMN